MYCTECGEAAEGNYCASCGAALKSSERRSDIALDYSEFVSDEKARSTIAYHAGLARKGMSAREFLSYCDKALQPLFGIRLEPIIRLVVPVYSALGIKTGKTHIERVPRPGHDVLLSLLCSFARNNQALVSASQAIDGCILKAKLPSDFWSFEGTVVASLRIEGEGTVAELATSIPGQLYDWGKSKRALRRLASDLLQEPARV